MGSTNSTYFNNDRTWLRLSDFEKNLNIIKFKMDK